MGFIYLLTRALIVIYKPNYNYVHKMYDAVCHQIII